MPLRRTMGETPSGFVIPKTQVSKPRLSASAVLSRVVNNSDEILLGHRVSEMPSFPDFWSFPGGGISKIDEKVGELYPNLLAEKGKDRVASIALLRELVEEIGLTPNKDGKMISLDGKIREIVCEDKKNWLKEFEEGNIIIEKFDANVISERVTPPFTPIRFQNRFFHVSVKNNDIGPTFPPGRTEFDEFKWWKPHELLNSWKQNEIRLPPPIVTLIRDLVESMDNLGNLENACNLMARERPSGYHRIEFSPEVECFPIRVATLPPSTHTNCYILGEEGGDRVIVDPAAKSERSISEFSDKVSEILDTGSTIIATIFTHRHPDHIGDLSKISEIYQAPIWASKETYEAIPECDSDIILKEGSEFALKGRSGESIWKVIETPGHCPGHICLIGESGIISGDNCVGVGTILVPSEEGDMGNYVSGLEKLRDMRPKMLFPGHGPLIANPSKLLNKYIDHRKNRQVKILEAISKGISDLGEITKFTYLDTSNANIVLANDQVLAHLIQLIKEKKVRKDGRRYYLHGH